MLKSTADIANTRSYGEGSFWVNEERHSSGKIFLFALRLLTSKKKKRNWAMNGEWESVSLYEKQIADARRNTTLANYNSCHCSWVESAIKIYLCFQRHANEAIGYKTDWTLSPRLYVKPLITAITVIVLPLTLSTSDMWLSKFQDHVR